MSTALNLRVGNLMTLNPVTISPDEPAQESEHLLKTHRISGLPVVEAGVVIGTLSQTDLLTARSSELVSGNWPRLKVSHLMSQPAMSVSVTASVESAARADNRAPHPWLVVVDDAMHRSAL